MIVFDLTCGAQHVFEAWFGSSTAFEEQRARGLVACPLCGDTQVGKALMAPNIAAKGNRQSGARTPTTTPDATIAPEAIKVALCALADAQAKALEKSQWVGRTFADRARAMHAGEEIAAPIHGQSTRAEAIALIEEGVEIAPLLLPVVPPEVLN
ncbi:DUF1178 family protein [Sphingomonas qilianensis]|uniref:DUF1178 family protein n=1 Tax=Sphingomonas qilianensis TaxID=1736690 RepID=A0ABU9XN11_9SPHN